MAASGPKISVLRGLRKRTMVGRATSTKTEAKMEVKQQGFVVSGDSILDKLLLFLMRTWKCFSTPIRH